MTEPAPAAGTRLCGLERLRGHIEPCPEGRCPFWEPGGAALEGACVFDRVGLPDNPELAEWLLDLRRKIESAHTPAEEREARHLYHRLLNADQGE
jgi:hypothetical protein